METGEEWVAMDTAGHPMALAGAGDTPDRERLTEGSVLDKVEFWRRSCESIAISLLIFLFICRNDRFWEI